MAFKDHIKQAAYDLDVELRKSGAKANIKGLFDLLILT